MFVYSIIMFLTAALFLALTIAIHNGNTKLILNHHQTNIKESEQAEYGKAFAKRNAFYLRNISHQRNHSII